MSAGRGSCFNAPAAAIAFTGIPVQSFCPARSWAAEVKVELLTAVSTTEVGREIGSGEILFRWDFLFFIFC